MKAPDMVLDALLAAGKHHAPDLPETLLRSAYEIQINNLFERDRDIPLKEMARLVEDYVNNNSSE